ncbi:MAG: hypothetical protein ABI760_18120, partial [Ferruginibacter sp.]
EASLEYRYPTFQRLVTLKLTTLPVKNACLTASCRQACLLHADSILAKHFIEYEHRSASFYEIRLVKHFRSLD